MFLQKKFNIRYIKKYVIAFILLFVYMFMQMIIIYADNTSWADKDLNEWHEAGLINKVNFRPSDKITRAEIASFINKMQEYTEKSSNIKNYLDVQFNDSCYQDMAIALGNEYMSGVSNTLMNPKGHVTREQAMVMISKIALLKSDNVGYLKARDANAVSGWAKEGVSTSINNGFVLGYEGNIFPKKELTRAEAVIMLNRKRTDTRVFGLRGIYDLYGTIVRKIEIKSGGITLKNAKVIDDLIIDAEVGDGEVYLENVSIENNVFAYGGGEASLYFTDIDVKKDLEVLKKDGKIKIVSKGNSNIPKCVLKSGASLINEVGNATNIKSVELSSDMLNKQEVKLDGSFDKLTNNKEGAVVKANGSIGKLVINAAMTIEGDVEIKEVIVKKGVKASVKSKNGKVIKLDSNTKSLNYISKKQKYKSSSSGSSSSSKSKKSHSSSSGSSSSSSSSSTTSGSTKTTTTTTGSSTTTGTVTNKVRVIYHSNYGAGEIKTYEMNKNSLHFIGTYELTPRAGKRFKNWNTKADGTGTNYNVGKLLRIKHDLNLYAVWQ